MLTTIATKKRNETRRDAVYLCENANAGAEPFAYYALALAHAILPVITAAVAPSELTSSTVFHGQTAMPARNVHTGSHRRRVRDAATRAEAHS